MRVLALDSTTRDGSVALVTSRENAGSMPAREFAVVDSRGDGSRSYAERLPGDLVALLEAQKLSLADVFAFAVASGPGSFTGLRVGIATMQGLAFAAARPLIAVSALDALAHLVAE